MCAPGTGPKHLEFPSGQEAIGFDVLLTGLYGYFSRQSWRWRLLVPFYGLKIVAHELLVIRVLSLTRSVGVDRPKARGIRCKDFVGEGYARIGAAKLELGVRDDDPFLAGIVGRFLVNAQRERAELLRELGAKDSHHAVKGNIFVVSGFGLGRGRKDWLGELIRVA